MLASDPDFLEIDSLNQMLTQLENPSMVWGYCEGDMPEADG
jgi:hypothetical protein